MDTKITDDELRLLEEIEARIDLMNQALFRLENKTKEGVKP